jgi:hypothetical protein
MNWLAASLMAMFSFGFLGLFNKLSTFQDPALSNTIIYAVPFACALVIAVAKRSKLSFSKESFVAGIFAGLANLIVICMLVSNFVMSVYPFVSLSSVVFFLIIMLTERPTFSKRQKMLVLLGILMSVLGLFIASTSTAGGIASFMSTLQLSLVFLLLGLSLSVSGSLQSFFSYIAMKKKNIDIVNSNVWVLLGALAMSLVSIALLGSFESFAGMDSRTLYPVAAGFSMLSGYYFILIAFKMTTGRLKIQETVVSILTNSEIIPLIFLSYFVLGEFTLEGIVGSVIVFAGISILNSADKI